MLETLTNLLIVLYFCSFLLYLKNFSQNKSKFPPRTIFCGPETTPLRITELQSLYCIKISQLSRLKAILCSSMRT